MSAVAFASFHASAPRLYCFKEKNGEMCEGELIPTIEIKVGRAYLSEPIITAHVVCSKCHGEFTVTLLH